MALVSAAFSGFLCFLFLVADSGAFCDGGVDCRSGNERIESLLAFLLAVSFLVVTVGLLGRWHHVVFIAAMSAFVLELTVFAREGDLAGDSTFLVLLTVALATPVIAVITALSMRPRVE